MQVKPSVYCTGAAPSYRVDQEYSNEGNRNVNLHEVPSKCIHPCKLSTETMMLTVLRLVCFAVGIHANDTKGIFLQLL